MNWPDVVSQGFPRPRPEEPGALRRDIADELADHLACAMSRELRRTDDPAAAEKNVLRRFGNPAAIARQLWWDAMKETVMRDRILIGAVLVLLLAVGIGALFTWQALSQSRQVNAAILAKLESLGAPAAQPEVPANWSKLRVRVLQDSKSGPPAPDHEVTLVGKAFNDSEDAHLRSITDAQGLAEFGPVRPGTYNLGMRLGLDWPMRSESGVTLYPGQLQDQTRCWPGPEHKSDAAFRVNLPADWAEHEFLALCEVHPVKRIIALDGTPWEIDWQKVCITPRGEVLENPGFSSGRPPYAFGSSHIITVEWPMKLAAHLAVPAVEWQLTELHIMQPRQYWPGQFDNRAKLQWDELAQAKYDPGQTPRFKPKAGAENVWTIEVPPKLVEEVKTRLDAQAGYGPALAEDQAWLELWHEYVRVRRELATAIVRLGPQSPKVEQLYKELEQKQVAVNEREQQLQQTAQKLAAERNDVANRLNQLRAAGRTEDDREVKQLQEKLASLQAQLEKYAPAGIGPAMPGVRPAPGTSGVPGTGLPRPGVAAPTTAPAGAPPASSPTFSPPPRPGGARR